MAAALQLGPWASEGFRHSEQLTRTAAVLHQSS
jgi:hypothetical protein